jgi:hypothetical protein
MLRDYLSQHKLRLLVWNLPEPHARAYDSPHILTYRWVRYGEYSDALNGLPFPYRAELFGEMVIGAPRQLLSSLRPNEIGNEALDVPTEISQTGYNGGPFVRDNLPDVTRSDSDHLLTSHSRLLRIVGPAPGTYQLYFARKVMELAASHGCRVVILHIPLDSEYGLDTVPELADWSKAMGQEVDVIAEPSVDVFPGIEKRRFLNFYRDDHLNDNGRHVFTNFIIPSILKVYDETAPDKQ